MRAWSLCSGVFERGDVDREEGSVSERGKLDPGSEGSGLARRVKAPSEEGHAEEEQKYVRRRRWGEGGLEPIQFRQVVLKYGSGRTMLDICPF